MSAITAILFDVDGTLLDTVEYIVSAYSHTAKVHGFADVTREMVIGVGGQGLEECYESFAPGYDPAPLCITHRDFQASDAFINSVTVYPGVISVLSGLRARGLKIGAVTSRKRTALRTLEITGLTTLIDGVVTGDDVVRCKPDPEGMKKAMALLGATADTAIMVGDTASDILAARRAGVRSVGVRYGFYSPDDYAVHPPDYEIDDLMEFPAIIDKLNSED